MPITSNQSLCGIAKLSGAYVPESLRRKFENNSKDHVELEAIGIEQTVKQCKELLGKVPCIHFYTIWINGDLLKL